MGLVLVTCIMCAVCMAKQVDLHFSAHWFSLLAFWIHVENGIGLAALMCGLLDLIGEGLQSESTIAMKDLF